MNVRLAVVHRGTPFLHRRPTLNPRHWALALALAVALPGLAGGRARSGGTLLIVAASANDARSPAEVASPVEAALLSLTSTPVCRLAQATRPTPQTLVLTTPHSREVAAALERVRAGPTPYRALLSSVGKISLESSRVELSLSSPSPELETVLCHPALSAAVAPFVDGQANPNHPGGRPWPDALTLQRTELRGAERARIQRRSHIVLGVGPAEEATLAFATYLRVAPEAPAGLRAAVEASVDRAELTRFFVRAPAQPLNGLLPPALGGPTSALTTARPPRTPTPVDVVIGFDAHNDDHRAIAQKLQVKLQPLGYRLALSPVAPGAAVPALSLHTLLLPPAAASALELTRTLAGDSDGHALVPLCLQGLAVTASPDVRHLQRDGYGLPRLDDVFLSPE